MSVCVCAEERSVQQQLHQPQLLPNGKYPKSVFLAPILFGLDISVGDAGALFFFVTNRAGDSLLLTRPLPGLGSATPGHLIRTGSTVMHGHFDFRLCSSI